MLLWDGSCIVHEAFCIDKLLDLYQKNPGAVIIAHPESEEHILKTAKYIGSTSGMINYVKEHPNEKFIVATEAGILHEMLKEVPGANLLPAPATEDNTCACSECGYMKVNTLQKLYDCLLYETPEIHVSENIRKKALIPIERMLELSKSRLMISVDYLVIGSGVAGLTFAVKIAENFSDKKICIVTKSSEDESNTKYAQGGVAVVQNLPIDSFEKHIQDTLTAGDGLCDVSVVEMVIKEGPDRLNDLMLWGASFDRGSNGLLNLAKEGGHSEHRIVHTKDLTGYEIERALLKRVHQ